MPTIEFTGNHFGANKTIEAEGGGDLVDICDEGLLEPPSEIEQELLEILRGPANSRLACQARVKSTPGLIKLRSLLA